uniref:Uncharacterized protein n=1 Tax=Romanomermis culicivorax TaxID=13658 RepID=A0A915JFW7_ROMCU
MDGYTRQTVAQNNEDPVGYSRTWGGVYDAQAKFCRDNGAERACVPMGTCPVRICLALGPT